GSAVQIGGRTYTLANIQANHRVQIPFPYAPLFRSITASAGNGGSIVPSGTITKNAGDSQAFTASPNLNYVVDQWLLDGSAVQTGGSKYTRANIQDNHSAQVAFTFVPPKYTITASAG